MNYFSYYHSPVAWLKLVADDTAIKEVSFDKKKDNISYSPISESVSPVIDQCIIELNEYFTGNREIFTVQLKPSGTMFQERVWQLLRTIPFAKTVSYSYLATALGDIKS